MYRYLSWWHWCTQYILLYRTENIGTITLWIDFKKQLLMHNTCNYICFFFPIMIILMWILLFWLSIRTFLHGLNLKMGNIFLPLPKCSILAPVTLTAPLPKTPVCSDWWALTGLSRHRPPCFCISSACFIATTAWGDTKPCQSAGGSFQAEYQLHVFLCGLSVLIFLKYLN